MLFGQNQNTDILISLLNSLLNFRGENIIQEVTINPSNLVVSKISHVKGDTEIAEAVDILCTTNNNKKIAIEIQGQKSSYFLPRAQDYMASLIFGQIKEGEGKEYHVKVLDTYVLVIAKENMFVGNTSLNGKVIEDPNFDAKNLYELDVEPTVRQTGEIVPGNKMHWKFFELSNFQNSFNYQNINKGSEMKKQIGRASCRERVSSPV